MADKEPRSNKPSSPAMSTDTRIPVGIWIFLEIPEHPRLVAFTYVDSEAGFSAQGWIVDDSVLDTSAQIIVRLRFAEIAWRPLESDEIEAFGLETPPSWITEFYAPQPPAGTLWGTWREHPHLQGRFPPEYPDDLQVLVHDGGPRFTRHPPEIIWVRINGEDGDIFQGQVLNQPHNLQSVQQGSTIRFIAAGKEHPLVMVTEKYLRERADYEIHPCDKCGLTELFDAPSDLLRLLAPNPPSNAANVMFTTFCPLCGGEGMLRVMSRTPVVAEGSAVALPAPSAAKRPWWRFRP